MLRIGIKVLQCCLMESRSNGVAGKLHDDQNKDEQHGAGCSSASAGVGNIFRHGVQWRQLIDIVIVNQHDRRTYSSTYPHILASLANEWYRMAFISFRSRMFGFGATHEKQ